MRKTFRNAALFSLIFALAQPMLTGCKDYDGDISNLQEQITSNDDGMAQLKAALESQLAQAQSLANQAQTLANNAQSSADQAMQAAKDAQTTAGENSADLEKTLKEYANSAAEAARQAAVEEAAEAVADDLELILAQLETAGNNAEAALTLAQANQTRIATAEGKLTSLESDLAALQNTVNGLNILSAADVTNMINKALSDAGLTTLPQTVSDLNQKVQDLATQQQSLANQIQTLEGYKKMIEDLEAALNTTNENVAALTTRIGNLEGTVSALETALADYAKTSYVQDYVQAQIAGLQNKDQVNALITEALGNYYTKDQIDNLFNGYLTGDDIKNFVTSSELAKQLEDYVTSTDLTTTLNDYYTSLEVDNLLKSYVTATSLAKTLEGYVKTEDLQNYSTTAQVNKMIEDAISDAISEDIFNSQAWQDAFENYLKEYNIATQDDINALQGIVDSIQQDINALEYAIRQININLIALQTDMLRGLIFYTDVYVGGIPALDYEVVNYGAYKFATANNPVSATMKYAITDTDLLGTTVANTVQDQPIYTAANTPTTGNVTEYFYPLLQAQYTLNPSSVNNLTADQLEIVRRGVTVRADEDEDILGELNITNSSIEDGMLTLDLQYIKPDLNGASVSNTLSGNHFANPHNSMLFALVATLDVVDYNDQDAPAPAAEGDDQPEVAANTNTVTSDWGLFNPVSVTLSKGGAIVYANEPQTEVTPTDNVNFEITLNQGVGLGTVNGTYNPLYYTDLTNVTDVTSSTIGLYNAMLNLPTLALPYDNTMDLDEEVLVAFTMENQNNSQGDYYFTMTPAQLSKYGMTMNYNLIGYEVAGQTYPANDLGESSYVTLDGSVLTPNPQTVASLGHMPIVMCSVTDQHGDLLALAFVKLVIALPLTPAPVISAIDLDVYPYYPSVAETNATPLNYATLKANAAADPGMTITATQWINNYNTPAVVTVNPTVNTDYSDCFSKDAQGNITCTLQTYNQYTDIWQVEGHTVTATLVYKPNVTNLPTITIPVNITVARPQVNLGEKLPNWWWGEQETYAMAVLPVENSGTIGTTANTFSSVLPSLFNNKEVLDYTLTPVPETPGPVYVGQQLIPEGIFLNLLNVDDDALTVPDGAWALKELTTTPWAKDSYNFYLQGNGTNNNSTFTMTQYSYLDGTYTLSVENAGPTLAAGQTYWDYVLQNPFQITSPQGKEYSNVIITAKDSNGNKHNIITLNQSNGEVMIGTEADGTTPDEIALAILNSMSSYQYGSNLVANLGVVTWGDNGYSVSTVNNLFNLNMLRPINVYWKPIEDQKWNQEPATYYIQDGLSVTNVTNSVAAGSYPTTTLTAAQYAWFNAYQLDLNITKSTYTVEGKTYDLSEYLTATDSPVTPSTWYTNAFSGEKGYQTSFTDSKGVVNECISLWADTSNVNAAGTPNFGGIVLSSNFVPSKTTTVTVPAALTYSWGSIFFNVTIVIEPYIFGN